MTAYDAMREALVWISQESTASNVLMVRDVARRALMGEGLPDNVTRIDSPPPKLPQSQEKP